MDPIIPDESAFLDDLLADESETMQVAAAHEEEKVLTQAASFDAGDWLSSIGDEPNQENDAAQALTKTMLIPVMGDLTSQSLPAGIPAPSSVLNQPFIRPESVSVDESSVVKSLIARQGFRVGNLQLMVPFDSASELSEMLPIYRLPNCASWFKGLINLHGNLIPVFDLANLFGVKHSSQGKPMLLVLNRLEPAAVIVDGMPQRLRFTSQQRIDMPVLPRYLKEGTTAAYSGDQGIWLDIDAARIFASASQKLAA